MSGAPKRPWRRRLLAFVVGLAIIALVAEIVLRFFPVSTGLRPRPVNAEHTVFQFEPNRDYVFSRDWNFHVANKGRVNDDGFVNDQDYLSSDAKTPLIAIIGDSFVEAQMVPYAETLQGRLAKEFAGKVRVFSFAASGAPLSQYLIWAEYVRDRYKPAGMVFVVVGNDFDESLAKYSICPGQHHFVPNDKGELELRRFDFTPSSLSPLVYSSALARYLNLNLKLSTRVSALTRWIRGDSKPESTWYVGNTPAEYTPERMSDSQKALDAFFRELPARSGLPVDRICFLLDAMRPEIYDEAALAKARASYFGQMRAAFLKASRERFYETIDLEPFFQQRHATDNAVFEFPTDYHWNGTGHEVAARAFLGSRLQRKVR